MFSRPLFCFIDDSNFEIDIFKRYLEPAFKGVDFLYVTNFEEIREKVKGRLISCFLLDIWGEVALNQPIEEEFDFNKLRIICKKLEKLEKNYGKLNKDLSSEKRNFLLREIYSNVVIWQLFFANCCKKLGQTQLYGIKNLIRVKESYPWSVSLAYSRKSFFINAIEMLKEGVDGVLQKPQGGSESEIILATKKEANELVEVVYDLIDKKFSYLALTLSFKNLKTLLNKEIISKIFLTIAKNLNSSLIDESILSFKDLLHYLKFFEIDKKNIEKDLIDSILSLFSWFYYRNLKKIKS